MHLSSDDVISWNSLHLLHLSECGDPSQSQPWVLVVFDQTSTAFKLPRNLVLAEVLIQKTRQLELVCVDSFQPFHQVRWDQNGLSIQRSSEEF